MNLATPVDVLDQSRSPLSKIVRLAWPVTLSMSFHTSYSIVDMFWVSSLGTDAVAAVTLSGIIFWLSFAVSQVFAGGSHALVARAYGAGSVAKAGGIVRDSLIAAVVAGVVLGLVAGGAPGTWLRLLGAAAEVSAVGVPYVRIMATGFAASMALFTLSSVFRATGDMVTPLILNAASCALNIVLDPLLIFGFGPVPAFGLAGAALASVIAMVLTLVWGLALVLRRGSPLHVPLRGMPDTAALRDLFAIGIPSGLHYILISLTHTAMIRMTAVFGTQQVAATGIGSRIAQLSFLPCMGIGAATATIVGQYLGAGRGHEAEHAVATALRVNFVITAVIGLFYACFPNLLLGMFTKDTDVLALGSVYLRLYAVGFIFVTATIVLTRVFQGAGDTVWPALVMALRFASFLAVASALAWLTDLQAYGVWLAMVLCSAGQTVVIAWVYRKGTWKRKRLSSLESDGSVDA